jgi:hypothetical protein
MLGGAAQQLGDEHLEQLPVEVVIRSTTAAPSS